MHTNKGEAKRKFNLIESNPTKIAVIKKKVPLKAELSIQLKELQLKFDTLEEENKTLKQEIEELKNNGTERMQEDQDTQTKAEFTEIACIECIFLASCEEELNWHMGEEHDQDYVDYFDTEFPCSVCSKGCQSERELKRHKQIYHHKKVKRHSLECNHCEDNFEKKHEVLEHMKKVHAENVSACWNFASGFCEFGELKCWFSHSELGKNQDKPTNLKCNICKKTFINRFELLKHRKQNHLHLVPLCKNVATGSCRFGEENCWFKHTETEISEKMNDKNEDNVRTYSKNKSK